MKKASIIQHKESSLYQILLLVVATSIGILNAAQMSKTIEKSATHLNQELFDAIEKNDIEVVKKLFSAPDKPNINSQTKNGWTPLIYAITKGHDEIGEFLINAGADITIERKGFQPISYAVYAGRSPHLVQLLIEKESQINKQDADGCTPLFLAVNYEYPRLVELLIKAKADITIRDKDEFTPFEYAAQQDHTDISKIFIDLAKDINAHNEGWTFLTIAAAYGNLKLVELLINTYKAHIDSENGDRETSLFLAIKKGHIDIAKFLIESGAKSNITTYYDETPLKVAEREGYTELVDLLIKNGAKEPSLDCIVM